MSSLPRERLGHPPPPALQQRRQAMATALADGVWRITPPPVEAFLAGVRVLRFGPPGVKKATVMHLHGGAFRQGCPEMLGAFAAALASRCNVEVVCPAYRLAPEYPFPAGLRDALSVMRALAAEQEGALIIAGDSAGGGLAASVTRLCLDGGMSITALVLLSAWLDLTVTSSCFEDNATTDPLFSRAAAEEAAGLYLQGLPARDMLASPLFGSPDGFPPTFISIGTGEVLAEDGRRVHRVLQAAGIRSELHPMAGMEHVAVTRNLNATGAAETLQALVNFITSVL